MTSTATMSNSRINLPSKNRTDLKQGQFNGRPSTQSLAYEKKVADIDTRIAVAKARLEDLKGGEGSAANVGAKGIRGELAEQVKKLREELRPHQEERRQLMDKLTKKKEEAKRKHGEVAEAKEKLPVRNISELNDRIKQLESKIESGQFTLTEEKQTLAEISKLNKTRKALENLDGNSSDVNSMRLQIEILSGKVSEKDVVIKEIRVKLDTINAKFDELNGVKANEQLKRQDRQAAFEKAKKDLDAAYAQKREAYEEYRRAKEAAAIARQKRDERRTEMDRRREIEEQIEDLEEKLLAFNPETNTDKRVKECNNIKSFFYESIKEGDVVSTHNVAKVESGLRQVKLSSELANAEAIIKDRDECFFAPKPKKGSKQSPATGGDLSSLLKKLPLHILSGLADLRLPIPESRSDIDKLFEMIEAKKLELSSELDDAVAEKELQRAALENQIAELKKKLDEKPIRDPSSEATATN